MLTSKACVLAHSDSLALFAQASERERQLQWFSASDKLQDLHRRSHNCGLELYCCVLQQTFSLEQFARAAVQSFPFFPNAPAISAVVAAKAAASAPAESLKPAAVAAGVRAAAGM